MTLKQRKITEIKWEKEETGKHKEWNEQEEKRKEKNIDKRKNVRDKEKKLQQISQLTRKLTDVTETKKKRTKSAKFSALRRVRREISSTGWRWKAIKWDGPKYDLHKSLWPTYWQKPAISLMGLPHGKSSAEQVFVQLNNLNHIFVFWQQKTLFGSFASVGSKLSRIKNHRKKHMFFYQRKLFKNRFQLCFYIMHSRSTVPFKKFKFTSRTYWPFLKECQWGQGRRSCCCSRQKCSPRFAGSATEILS